LTTLGAQSPGCWGYHHGMNERGVTIGCVAISTRLPAERAGLVGTDLVRLGLERSSSARQAVDLVDDLIGRHGQGAGGAGAALLIADESEAFAVEASGHYWVVQELREVRALNDACTIRQDWDRISPGLASQAIAQGLWPGDGSKLDFAAALGGEAAHESSAMRRWGRATQLLDEQNGHIDLAFVRRLLADHYETCIDEVDPLDPDNHVVPLCQHGSALDPVRTALSLVADLGGHGRLPLAWSAFGPPCISVYFPICLLGDLPEQFGRRRENAPDTVCQRLLKIIANLGTDRQAWSQARESVVRLQAHFDQLTDEFIAEAIPLSQQGALNDLQRRAGLFMQHNLRLFTEVADSLQAPRRPVRGVSVAT
jgi:dipeptidase